MSFHKPKQHYVSIGYNDPTIVYEIQLVKVAEIPPLTPLIEIVARLKRKGVVSVLVDVSQPKETDMMRDLGLVAQRVILITPEEKI